MAAVVPLDRINLYNINSLTEINISKNRLYHFYGVEGKTTLSIYKNKNYRQTEFVNSFQS
ncbi:hypothetical protein JCM37172_06440 [Faecalimonas hominis]|jgi:hypothetical protein